MLKLLSLQHKSLVILIILREVDNKKIIELQSNSKEAPVSSLSLSSNIIFNPLPCFIKVHDIPNKCYFTLVTVIIYRIKVFVHFCKELLNYT